MSFTKALIIGAVALAACRSDHSYDTADLRATPPETFSTKDSYTAYDMNTRIPESTAWSNRHAPAERSGTAEESFDTSELYANNDRYSSTEPNGVTVREAGATRNVGALSADEQDFVTQLFNGGRFEVQSSQLALQKGISGQHREFAETMLADHGQVNREIERIAARREFDLPLALDTKHEALLDELRELDGSAFAKRYHDLQVTGHEHMVNLLEEGIRDCDDADVRVVAEKALAAARRHLDHLRAIGTPR
jgi:putative membrane protein